MADDVQQMLFHHPNIYHRGILSYLGIRASAVPFLLPKPLCLPIRRAAFSSRALARECMVTGLRMMRPSETNLRMVWREFALEISLTSLGSSQILRLPQPATDAARRFWVRRLTLREESCQYLCCVGGVLFAAVIEAEMGLGQSLRRLRCPDCASA